MALAVVLYIVIKVYCYVIASEIVPISLWIPNCIQLHLLNVVDYILHFENSINMVLISKGLLLIRKCKVVTHVFHVFEASTLLWLGKNNVPYILITYTLILFEYFESDKLVEHNKNIISPIFFPQSKRLLRYNVYKNFNMLRISV